MTTLYQLQLDQSMVNCGMSYVFQLENGRFFILDGGYFTPGEDARLYAFLTARAAGKPRIAGWYFSHAHQDHVGNFINFIRRYREDVQLDALYYNFQPADFSGVEGDWRSSDMTTFREFYRAIDEACPQVPRHILHTGDCVRIDELSFEVLYTHEDLPSHEGIAFNDMSTVILVTVAGQRILFLGDAFRAGSKCLLARPEALRCDIVQVSHHGFHGATEDVYHAAAAQVALWPTPAYEIDRLRRLEVNRYLLDSNTIQEHLISGLGTAMLTLPYRPGTAEIDSDADLLAVTQAVRR